MEHLTQVSITVQSHFGRRQGTSDGWHVMGNWVIVSRKLFFNLNVLNLRRRRTHCCATINHSPYKLMEIFYQSSSSEYGRTCKDIGKAWHPRKHETAVRSLSDFRKLFSGGTGSRFMNIKKGVQIVRLRSDCGTTSGHATPVDRACNASSCQKVLETFWQSRDTRVTANRPPMATGTSAHEWNCFLKIFLPFPRLPTTGSVRDGLWKLFIQSTRER